VPQIRNTVAMAVGPIDLEPSSANGHGVGAYT
jgi:hypothetical protein